MLVVGSGLRADVVAVLLQEDGWRVSRGPAAPGATPCQLAVVIAAAVGDIVHGVGTFAERGVSVLVVTSDTGVATTAALLLAGARSVLTEDASGPDLVHAAHLTARGLSVVQPHASRIMSEQWRHAHARTESGAARGLDVLTDRERQVLSALARGLTGKAVARSLGISLKTVEAHKANIFARLGVRTQSQAVSVAVRAGLSGPVGRER